MAKEQDKPAQPVTAPPSPPAAESAAPQAPKGQTAAPAPKPANGPQRFRVSLGDESAEVVARDGDEAWAKFCDSRKAWPGPKVAGRKVEAIGG